jgi:hypothetical protein
MWGKKSKRSLLAVHFPVLDLPVCPVLDFFAPHLSACP